MNTAPPSSSGSAVPAGTPGPAPSAHLPHARHLERLPAEIGLAGLARIRQAAYALPQVLRPADLDPAEAGDGSPEAREARLDALGLIQLQKAVAGQRPSRWIAPAEMAAALAHLDAIGKVQNARPLMLERAAALEALGIARRNRGWTRLIKHVMKLSEPGWSLPVLFRQALAAEPVWAYYRSGDRAALLADIGAPRPYPEAPALLAHIEALIARGRAEHAAHLPSLLPRLQAECATPQGESRLEELQAACSRAYARWERQVNEADALQGLNSELAFQGYPDSFGIARKLGRKVQLFVGPPNSGKTHAAFERLTQAAAQPDGLGAYLAPLRLLALEGRDRLVARGVPCSLLTGEENVPAADARVVSSTIEMLATAKVVDVAVIDEGQMIFDPSRGWAWTQAIVAAPARELIIICSAYAVPAISNLLGLCGETATVREFERKQHVQLLAHPVSLPELKRGDTVVAFSRREVLKLRDQVAAGGHSVSVIYGALPPEVRRREAERFASGASDILVATDAIGMGLNLPVRRVLFSTLTKFDGQGDRALDTSEVHQIAGRAGRFGIHDEGHAGVLASAEPAALRQLREAMHRHPHAPRDFKAPVAPNGWHIDTISARLAEQRLHAVLRVFVEQLRLDDAHFQVAELEQMLELAEQLDRVAAPLPLKQRFTYAQAPVDTRTESLLQAYYSWAAEHAQLDRVSAPWFLDEVDEHSRLERMEQALRACTLWLWLDLRFPGVYGHVHEVLDLRERLNDGIELQLKGQRPLALQRGRGHGRRHGPR